MSASVWLVSATGQAKSRTPSCQKATIGRGPSVREGAVMGKASFIPRKLLEQVVEVMLRSVAEPRTDGKARPPLKVLVFTPAATYHQPHRRLTPPPGVPHALPAPPARRLPCPPA